MALTFWIVLGVVLLLAGAAFAIVRVRREERRSTDRSALPQLVFFPPPSEITVTPRPMRPPPPPRRDVAPPEDTRPFAPHVAEPPPPRPAAAPGTLALLPGRLEVVAGEARGHDIRFVRTAPNGVQRVTLGRGEGPPYEHVQLRAATVSRRHAQLCYQDGKWTIMNLSSTNPLVLNGVPLPTDAAPRALDDGDMIELGEVVFRFRDH